MISNNNRHLEDLFNLSLNAPSDKKLMYVQELARALSECDPLTIDYFSKVS
jgi:hypothetical protein